MADFLFPLYFKFSSTLSSIKQCVSLGKCLLPCSNKGLSKAEQELLESRFQRLSHQKCDLASFFTAVSHPQGSTIRKGSLTFPYSATKWGPSIQIHEAMGGHFSSKLSQGHPLSTLSRNAPILLAFSTVFLKRF